MFDGVMILVLVLEHSWSTLEELEDQSGLTVEVAVIHNVYHWILLILGMNMVHKRTHTFMEQNMNLLIQ